MTVMQWFPMMGETGPHIANIIKQADETRDPSPFAITSDSELFFTARANTLYEIRCGVYASGTATGSHRFRLRCSTAVTHAALRLTRMFAVNADGWPSGADRNRNFCWSTVQFNDDDRNFQVAANALTETAIIYGIIKTNTAGVISLHWGAPTGSGVNLTVHSGSWLSAVEGEEV